MFLGGRPGTSPVISFNGVTAKEPAQKAELSNGYFCFVFLPAASNVNRAEVSISPTTVMEFSQIEVSLEEVRDYLNGLDTSKAYGPNGITARLLKQCSEQIAPSICVIFNNPLSSGRIPREWKSAVITSIRKKESK